MNRFDFALATAALVLTTPTMLLACSEGDISVGALDQKLQTTANGGPTGNGQTCSWSDSVSYDTATGQETRTPAPNGEFQVGDKFKSSCNDCTCTTDGITCTEKECLGEATCEYHGHTWRQGQAIPSLDKCNQYQCTKEGLESTLMGCAYECPAETFIDCEPVVPEERLALCYGPYHEWIVANCEGVDFGL